MGPVVCESYLTQILDPINELNLKIKSFIKLNYNLFKQSINFFNFSKHLLLVDSDKCQRVIEYYLGNGYDLVDKYDEKML
jgi:hypothetical protein